MLDNPEFMRNTLLRMQPPVVLPTALLAGCYAQLDCAWTAAKAEEDAEKAESVAKETLKSEARENGAGGGGKATIVAVATARGQQGGDDPAAGTARWMERNAWNEAVMIVTRFWATRRTCHSNKLVVPLLPAAPFKFGAKKARESYFASGGRHVGGDGGDGGRAAASLLQRTGGVLESFPATVRSGSSDGGGGGGGGGGRGGGRGGGGASAEEIMEVVNSPRFKTPPGKLKRRLAIDEAGQRH